MKATDKKRMARAVCALAPPLRAKGTSLLAVSPFERILRGIYLETSPADPAGVYLWSFIQPLFVPATHVVLSLGERLGGGSKTWRAEEAGEAAELIRDQALPFFASVSSPEELARWLDSRTDLYALEVSAYALVASNRCAQGAYALRELAEATAGDDRPWALEINKRALRLAGLAKTHPEGAQWLLVQWEAATVSALGLQALASLMRIEETQ